MKSVDFRGSLLVDFRDFPDPAKREAGYQIDKVQHGLDLDDWKPMESIGAGVKEIRVKDDSGIYRILYVAKFAQTVYVFHCFKSFIAEALEGIGNGKIQFNSCKGSRYIRDLRAGGMRN